MTILDDFDLHQIHWPGSEPQSMAARLSVHRDSDHELVTALKHVGSDVARATLSCSCGATIVMIDFPQPVELQRLISVGPVRTSAD